MSKNLEEDVTRCYRAWIGILDELAVSQRQGAPLPPQAASLLTALKDPECGFDAVVIGEPQRAFTADPAGCFASDRCYVPAV